jgi:hypothetical protein
MPTSDQANWVMAGNSNGDSCARDDRIGTGQHKGAIHEALCGADEGNILVVDKGQVESNADARHGKQQQHHLRHWPILIHRKISSPLLALQALGAYSHRIMLSDSEASVGATLRQVFADASLLLSMARFKFVLHSILLTCVECQPVE